MDFWNEFSKTIYSAADYTVKGTEKLTGIAKLKYKINAAQSKLDLYYKSIGELKYAEKHSETVTEDMYEGLFAQVDSLTSEIKEYERQLADLRDYTACAQCGYRVQKGLSYCPKCGEKINASKEKESQ